MGPGRAVPGGGVGGSHLDYSRRVLDGITDPLLGQGGVNWRAVGRTVLDAVKDTAFGAPSPMLQNIVFQILARHGSALKAAANGPHRAAIEQGLADILRRADHPVLELSPAKAVEAVGRLLTSSSTAAKPPAPAAASASAPSRKPATVPPIPSAAPQGPDLSPPPAPTVSRDAPLPLPKTATFQPLVSPDARRIMKEQERQRAAAELQAAATQQAAATARTTTTFGRQAQALDDLGARIAKLGADPSTLTNPAFQAAGNTHSALGQRLTRMDSLDKAIRQAKADGGPVTVGDAILQPAAVRQELASLRKSFDADLKTLRGQVAALEGSLGARTAAAAPEPALRSLDSVTGNKPGATDVAASVIKPQPVIHPDVGKPQEVPHAVPQTIPEKIDQPVIHPDIGKPQVVPSKIPQTVPGKVPQTVPTVERNIPEQDGASTTQQKPPATEAAPQPETSAQGGQGGGRARGPTMSASAQEPPEDPLSKLSQGDLIDLLSRSTPDAIRRLMRENPDALLAAAARLEQAVGDPLLSTAQRNAAERARANIRNAQGDAADSLSRLRALNPEQVQRMGLGDLGRLVGGASPDEILALQRSSPELAEAIRQRLSTLLAGPGSPVSPAELSANPGLVHLRDLLAANPPGGALAPIPGVTGTSAPQPEAVQRTNQPAPGEIGRNIESIVDTAIETLAGGLRPGESRAQGFQRLLGAGVGNSPEAHDVRNVLGLTPPQVAALQRQGDSALQNYTGELVVNHASAPAAVNPSLSIESITEAAQRAFPGSRITRQGELLEIEFLSRGKPRKILVGDFNKMDPELRKQVAAKPPEQNNHYVMHGIDAAQTYKKFAQADVTMVVIDPATNTPIGSGTLSSRGAVFGTPVETTDAKGETSVTVQNPLYKTVNYLGQVIGDAGTGAGGDVLNLAKAVGEVGNTVMVAMAAAENFTGPRSFYGPSKTDPTVVMIQTPVANSPRDPNGKLNYYYTKDGRSLEAFNVGPGLPASVAGNPVMHGLPPHPTIENARVTGPLVSKSFDISFAWIPGRTRDQVTPEEIPIFVYQDAGRPPEGGWPGSGPTGSEVFYRRPDTSTWRYQPPEKYSPPGRSDGARPSPLGPTDPTFPVSPGGTQAAPKPSRLKPVDAVAPPAQVVPGLQSSIPGVKAPELPSLETLRSMIPPGGIQALDELPPEAQEQVRDEAKSTGRLILGKLKDGTFALQQWAGNTWKPIHSFAKDVTGTRDAAFEAAWNAMPGPVKKTVQASGLVLGAAFNPVGTAIKAGQAGLDAFERTELGQRTLAPFKEHARTRIEEAETALRNHPVGKHLMGVLDNSVLHERFGPAMARFSEGSGKVTQVILNGGMGLLAAGVATGETQFGSFVAASPKDLGSELERTIYRQIGVVPKGATIHYATIAVPGTETGRVTLWAAGASAIVIPPGLPGQPGTAQPAVATSVNPNGKREAWGFASTIVAGPTGFAGVNGHIGNIGVAQSFFGTVGSTAANIPSVRVGPTGPDILMPGRQSPPVDLRVIFSLAATRFGATSHVRIGPVEILDTRMRTQVRPAFDARPVNMGANGKFGLNPQVSVDPNAPATISTLQLYSTNPGYVPGRDDLGELGRILTGRAGPHESEAWKTPNR